MLRPRLSAICSAALSVVLLSGCVYTHTAQTPQKERYVSPTIEGAQQRINLDEVEKAFFSTKGNDLNSWMSGFEKRVNEIYEGEEVVSIDATRETGKLQVTGFIEKNKEPGFQNGEDKLFSLEQTGDVVNNQMPYRVNDQHGTPYSQGHYSLLNNPIIEALVIGNLLSGLMGPRYYTPFASFGGLRNYRDNYRTTTAYQGQQARNSNFNTRFRQRAVGTGIGSNNRFRTTPGGTGRTTVGTPTRRPSFSSPSPWGGRRSTGFGRGWGMRRR
jgi:hypothetical protein